MNDNPKGVWLDAKKHEPQGGMVLMRRPSRTRRGVWNLALFYLSVSKTYVECSSYPERWTDEEAATHFMEIPE